MRNLDFIIVFIICVIFGIDGRRHTGVKHRESNAPFLRIKECERLEKFRLGKGEWNLLILHNNDMHSRFVETDAKQNECPAKDKEENKCYGGMARVATVVRQAREDASKGGLPVLFLNAGDTFAGTPWFIVHKAPLVALSLNLLRPDAASLGNHEFDLGAPGLRKYLELTYGYPVVASNIDLSKEPGLTFQKALRKSVVYKVRGHLVGIIGYVLPDTKILTISNNITFLDEIEKIKQEARYLKKRGVKILIALGHSGHEMDKKIAAEVKEIDLVVGGHSNTFLWNGEKPDREDSKGVYPVLIRQNKTHKVVPVVQAYAHTKYIGRLIITLNKCGQIIRTCGQPLLLDSKIPRAKDVAEFMKIYKGPVDRMVNEIIGKSEMLFAEICRELECALGRIVTRAILEAAYKYLNITNDTKEIAGTKISQKKNKRQGMTGEEEEDYSNQPSDLIVLQSAGGIRGNLVPFENRTVTYGMLMTVMPYENILYKCKITGKQLKSMLEWGVTRYEPNNKRGEFPQVVNLRVRYDLTKPVGDRVISLKVKILHQDKFKPYNDDDSYILITNNYIAQGGDGYNDMKDPGVEKENMGILDSKALSEYIKQHKDINDKFLKTLKQSIVIENSIPNN